MEFENSLPTFNMSLATLSRIDTLLRALNQSALEGHIAIIYRCNYILLKELFPFLNDTDKTYSINEWQRITSLFGFSDTFVKTTHESMDTLNNFEFWQRIKLYEHRLLFNKGEDAGAVLR
jgi:hypothetical protein